MAQSASKTKVKYFMKIIMQTFMLTIILSALSLAWAGEARYALRVDGLACPFCAYGIEKHLERIDGVRQAATELGDGVVIVTMAEGRELTEPEAKKAVDAAGFSLRGFERLADDNEG